MKLYVGNLSFDTTENDIQDLFAPFGEVREVALIQDKFTNRSRGFGFVTMGDSKAGEAAIAALHEKTVAGRALTVNEARAREERPSGGRDGDRSFSGPRR
jgi:cold-inducible RNA-binding protein